MLNRLINKSLDSLSSHLDVLTYEQDASFELRKVSITFEVKGRENFVPEGVGFVVPFHNLIVDAREMLLCVFEHVNFEQIGSVPEESETFVSHVCYPNEV